MSREEFNRYYAIAAVFAYPLVVVMGSAPGFIMALILQWTGSLPHGWIDPMLIGVMLGTGSAVALALAVNGHKIREKVWEMNKRRRAND